VHAASDGKLSGVATRLGGRHSVRLCRVGVSGSRAQESSWPSSSQRGPPLRSCQSAWAPLGRPSRPENYNMASFVTTWVFARPPRGCQGTKQGDDLQCVIITEIIVFATSRDRTPSRTRARESCRVPARASVLRVRRIMCGWEEWRWGGGRGGAPPPGARVQRHRQRLAPQRGRRHHRTTRHPTAALPQLFLSTLSIPRSARAPARCAPHTADEPGSARLAPNRTVRRGLGRAWLPPPRAC
jgi:hypothetical protein